MGSGAAKAPPAMSPGNLLILEAEKERNRELEEMFKLLEAKHKGVEEELLQTKQKLEAEKEAAHLAAEEARAAREKSEAEIKYLHQERDHLTHEVSETRDKADLKLQDLQDMMPTDDLAKERARRNEQMALDVKAKDLEEERLFLLSQHEPMEQEAQSLRKQFAKVYEEPAALAAEVQMAKLSDLKEQLAKFDEKSKALRERQETLAKRQEELAKDNEEVRAKTEESKLREGYEVQEPCHRGVRLGSLLDFFQEHCGDITFEGGDMRKPLCLATKLTRRCHQDNQANRIDIARKRTKPLSPNTFAVEKLFIRHLNEEHGSSVSGVWNGEPVQAEIFVSHCWTEDFGDFCQGLCRLALSIIAREAPWIPQEEVFAHAKELAFFIHAFSDNMLHEAPPDLKDYPVHQVLEAKTTKTLVLSLPEDASSLMRAWCIVELFLAKELGKEIVLNTRFGPLLEQPRREHQVQVLISFLVEVIPDIDLQKSQSWYEEDMLKLLSHMTDYVGPGTASGLNSLEALKNTMADIVASQSLAVLAQSGKALQVKAALDCRADPNARDGFGVTALTSAAGYYGEGSEVAQLLLAHGASPEALVSASEVLAMRSPEEATRVQAMAVIGELVKEEEHHVHAPALAAARREHARRLVEERLPQLRNNNEHNSNNKDDDNNNNNHNNNNNNNNDNHKNNNNHNNNNNSETSSAQVRASALLALAGAGKLLAPISGMIVPLLVDDDQRVKDAACEALLKIGGAEEHIDHLDPRVRSALLQALARGGNWAAHACIFARKLEDEDSMVRHNAVQGLLKSGPQASEFAAALAGALRDEQWYIRLNALQALSKIGSAAGPHMLAVALCLGDTHPEVRKFASELLGKVKSFAAAPLAPAAAQPTGQDPAAKKKEFQKDEPLRPPGPNLEQGTDDAVGDVPQVKEEGTDAKGGEPKVEEEAASVEGVDVELKAVEHAVEVDKEVMTSVQESQLGASKNTASIALGTSIFGHTQLESGQSDQEAKETVLGHAVSAEFAD